MNVETVWNIFFSPAGSTAKISESIATVAAQVLNVPVKAVNLTPPGAREREYHFTQKDLTVIAFPTYAGKLPNKILPDLKRCLHADSAPAIAVVTFGNRAFDNSLAELTDCLTHNGFFTVSAAAFASRHAFTDKVGSGRPDETDMAEINHFALASAEKVQNLTDIVATLTPSGNATLTPYGNTTVAPSGNAMVVPSGNAAAAYYVPCGTDGKPVNFLKAKPRTDLSKCSQCGTCARSCPMGSIDPEDVSVVRGICIKCQGCVRKCTRHAKYFDDAAFLSHVAMLEQNFTARAENQMFL